VSNILLSAAYPQAEFHGVDFNAEHIDNAKLYAGASGLENVHFVDAAFENYSEYNPPQFDFVALHGIYSWVSADVRKQILDLVQSYLKPGGLLYVSYNTLPGWAELMPLWEMMQNYTADLEMDSVSKAQEGLKYLKSLRDLGAGYFRDTPAASQYLDRMLKRDPSYVAHEFCNGIFDPHYFSDVAHDFASVGLDYAGTAKIHRNTLDDIVSSRFKPHLDEAASEAERQSRVSFIRNEFFRRDIYIKDPVRLSEEEKATALDDVIVGANVADAYLKDRMTLSRRTVSLAKPIYNKLIPLAKSGQYSIADLKSNPALSDYTSDDIVDAVKDLFAGYQFQPTHKAVVDTPVALNATYRLAHPVNRVFLEGRFLEEAKTYVASSSLGSAIRVKRVFGLYVLKLDGQTLDGARAAVKEAIIKMTDHQRTLFQIPSDKPLDVWLLKQEKRFVAEFLPILMRYGILQTAEQA
jgi:SAM-dependent methyltransferase